MDPSFDDCLETRGRSPYCEWPEVRLGPGRHLSAAALKNGAPGQTRQHDTRRPEELPEWVLRARAIRRIVNLIDYSRHPGQVLDARVADEIRWRSVGIEPAYDLVSDA